ncbi:ABC transporter ATP-binding protein [Muricoccus pecuniae]|uniref:Peptide/nickel transport system ATP-binding protein n=1 Tax=Muricoccus pecuniae TaxID=693023 RepID=A0A840YLY5_9PROT|nr:ABC transporter ATP-binding protein [Roseomonas pecuniae]MBB5695484.1 peptide/nickel transport system ATP-binding protein [Roseomonas pecuniae]
MTPLLSVEGVSKRFARPATLGDRLAGLLGRTGPRAVQAVTRVDLQVAPGEVLGLVGESGCGKSTLGRIVAGIYEPSEGAVLFQGAPVMSGGRKRTFRVQMIHQDPFASLDPRMRVGDTVAEGPLAHGLVKRAGADAFVADMLARVGLDPALRRRYPHQFSGGQRQRVAIARALALGPELLVLDEPVASLDVSIQAQVLNLFSDLRRELGLTGLFISHDLGVVRHVSDRVAIMYLGRIVELAPMRTLYSTPAHPYTRALLDSVPKLGRGRGAFRPIAGEIPSPLNPPPGCHFHPRCPHAGPRCRVEAPKLIPVLPGQTAACHLHDTGVSDA